MNCSYSAEYDECKNSYFSAFQAKHLQFVSGVNAVSFWLATYTWDFLNYLIPMLGVFIMFAAFQVDSYSDDLGTVFLLLVSKKNQNKIIYNVIQT